MNILSNKTITDVPGILAAGIWSGIKKDGKKDLCIIYSKYKANAAAVFTSNKIKAAPLILNMENIKNDNIQGIVVNSGNANSCTGPEGLENARRMAETGARCLKLSANEVLVASTGALAVQLPMDVIIPGIERACSSLSQNGGMDAAQAILTTDTRIKTVAVELEISGKKITMAGMTKGSAMIHPNMGTMLAFIVTDANISKQMLQKALKTSVDMSFNMVSIDGDTSTNDMAIVLANGCSGNNAIVSEDENYSEFLDALSFVSIELAKMIAKDGEGATKLIEVNVVNAKTLSDARRASRAVISSNLVKCAMFGGVLDWTKIALAAGYSGIDMKPDAFDIFIGSNTSEIQIVKNAEEMNLNKNSAKSLLSGDYVKIRIDLKNGENNAAAWGCDLTYNYVKANGYFQ